MINRRNFVGHGATALAATALPAAAQEQASVGRGRSGYIRTSDGVALFVKDWGTGRPIVLTHAWPLSSDCRERQAVSIALI